MLQRFMKHSFYHHGIFTRDGFRDLYSSFASLGVILRLIPSLTPCQNKTKQKKNPKFMNWGGRDGDVGVIHGQKKTKRPREGPALDCSASKGVVDKNRKLWQVPLGRLKKKSF